MIFAVSTKQTFDYVPESDRKSDTPTTFKLRTLTARELVAIEDRVTRLSQTENSDEVSISVFSGTQSLLALRYGLRGWENFSLPDGSEVKFKADRNGTPKDVTIDFIPSEIRQELSTAILDRSRLAEEETKN